MAEVTVTGGPFTDGLGNVLPGDWQFQPLPIVDEITDDAAIPVQGTLGGFSSYGTGAGAVITQSPPGEFVVVLAEGNYRFTLRTQIQMVDSSVSVFTSGGTAQTIEALLSPTTTP